MIFIFIILPTKLAKTQEMSLLICQIAVNIFSICSTCHLECDIFVLLILNAIQWGFMLGFLCQHLKSVIFDDFVGGLAVGYHIYSSDFFQI